MNGSALVRDERFDELGRRPVLQLAQGPGLNEPALPSDSRSGWVYRDPAGEWYLAVAAEGGQRLVRLTDFTLVPVGTAGTPLELAGSVEISVWPVTDRVPDA